MLVQKPADAEREQVGRQGVEHRAGRFALRPWQPAAVNKGFHGKDENFHPGVERKARPRAQIEQPVVEHKVQRKLGGEVDPADEVLLGFFPQAEDCGTQR